MAAGERDVLRQQAAKTGKPAKIIDKMVEGRLQKVGLMPCCPIARGHVLDMTLNLVWMDLQTHLLVLASGSCIMHQDCPCVPHACSGQRSSAMQTQRQHACATASSTDHQAIALWKSMPAFILLVMSC